MRRYVWFVTGCRGFLARSLCAQLRARGDVVYGMDAETYAAGPMPPLDAYATGDIATLDRLPDCDLVVNVAAETHVDNSIDDASLFVHTNFAGVHRLLELVRRRKAYRMPRFVQVSTDEVYGEVVEGAARPEDRLAPRNPYAATKAAADLLVGAYRTTHGLDTVILRMTNLYGAGQYREKLIPKTAWYAGLQRPLPLHAKGRAIRSWLWVEDAARAVILAALKGASGQIYHAGGNTEMTVAEVVSAIHEVVPGPIDVQAEREGMDHRYALDDTDLRALGWEPVGSFARDLPTLVRP